MPRSITEHHSHDARSPHVRTAAIADSRSLPTIGNNNRGRGDEAPAGRLQSTWERVSVACYGGVRIAQ